MATHIVVFKEAHSKYAKPEIYLCNSNEADEIQALLETVGEERNGPIERLPYTEFVEKAGAITVAELRGRFAKESDAVDEEAVYLNWVRAVLNNARPSE